METVTENDRVFCYNAVSLTWKQCKDTLMDTLKILHRLWEEGKRGKNDSVHLQLWVVGGIR